ncbi:MAG: tripartite tricarboxylate transporter permease [Pseudomonadota bacterium]
MDAGTAVSALLALLSSPRLLGLMTLAIATGVALGIVPGLGGKIALSLAIPFVFGMEPLEGAVFLVALHAVVHTGGAVPAILLGVPGTGPNVATVADGHAMAQNGEAGRALGAALLSSAVGGLIGALALALTLPLLAQLSLLLGPPEFFLLSILGLTTIAALSGNHLGKGIAVGAFGLLLACVGHDPLTGEARFVFGQLWLWDGVDIALAVLAFYALPELLDLTLEGKVSRTARGTGPGSVSAIAEGIRDVLRRRWLTLRCACLGTGLGAIPGVGGDAAAWICYGHAVQSTASPETMGRGNVDGVIGPEAANNAKEGGALIPTLAFAVPGSSGMAILLGGFVMLGVPVGPQLIAGETDLVWSLVWVLALANLAAAALLLWSAPALARIAHIPIAPAMPFILQLTLLGGVISAGTFWALPLMIALAGLGWLLKRTGWPRQPFVVGLVLGQLTEISLHQSLLIWGPAFVLRPQSLVLLALLAVGLVLYLRVSTRRRASPEAPVPAVSEGLAALLSLTVFSVALFFALGFSATASLLPALVASLGGAIALYQLMRFLRQGDIHGALRPPTVTASSEVVWWALMITAIGAFGFGWGGFLATAFVLAFRFQVTLLRSLTLSGGFALLLSLLLTRAISLG